MKNFKDVLEKARAIKGDLTIVVPCPYDTNILNALHMIKYEGIANVVLVGEKEKIIQLCNSEKIDITLMKVVNKGSQGEALEEACRMLESNEAGIIVKGIVDTSSFMKSILAHKGLRKSRLLTHISILEIPLIDKLLFVSDPSIIIEPNLDQKITIIDNALELLENLKIENPKIAIISSTEKPNENIKSSMDADKITELQLKEERWDADIYGPLSIDLAVSKEATKSKKMENTVAGDADLLIMPDLDSGNVFCKALVYLGGVQSAGVVMGAKKPIVLTSRSAGIEERFNSICLACLLAENMKN